MYRPGVTRYKSKGNKGTVALCKIDYNYWLEFNLVKKDKEVSMVKMW